MTPVIELNNLRIHIGRREILKGLSCRLSSRSIGLLGPNGAGKSTLIQTLLGFHKPAPGSARLFGLDCRTQGREVRARLGYMPENDSLIADMNAVTMVRMMAELSGLPPAQALEKAHETLFHVGLGENRYRKLGTYSLGMRQMARLAQAIVHGPELVILDEPTNGLDPSARTRMLQLIREMREQHGMTVLLCSHLLRDVEEVCDEVVILKDGAIVHHANLEEERRTNRRFVELEVEGSSAGLAHALQQEGAEAVDEGLGCWRIVLPPHLDIQAIWRLTAARNLAVRRLSWRRDTLEEIFLKAVGHLQTPPPLPAAATEETTHGR
jgi:ABC-2 type transport system ATP-binding protein